MEFNHYTKPNYWKHLTVLIVFLFLSSASAVAQKVLWETSYPKMSSETLGTYGDPVEIELKFSVSDAPLATPEFKITLPTGALAAQVTTGVGDTSGASYSMVLNGQELTITPSSTINVGAVVDIMVELTIESCNEADVTFPVKIYSGGTEIADAARSTSVMVRKPTVRVLSHTPSITTTAVNQVKQFIVDIDVANQLQTKSLKVFLVKNGFTKLENFKLDGVDLSSKVTESSANIEILLDDSILGGTLVGTTIKQLTFDASANVGSSHEIELSGQYPAELVCSTIASQDLTLTNPTISGTPSFALPDNADVRRWVLASDMDGVTLNANKGVVMDGQTISYLRLQYKNVGTAGAIQVKNSLQTHRSLPYTFAYIVPDQIQYSIDGGTTKHTIPSSDVAITKTLVEDNGYRLLKPGIAGKAQEVIVTINNPVDAGKDIVIYWPIIQGDIYDNDTYRPTISAGTAPYSSLQFMVYNLTATGGNGEAASVPSNTYGNGGINLPKFMTSLSSQGLHDGEHEESQITLDLGVINSADDQSVDLNIKIPAFLEIDGTMEEAIQLLGVDVAGKATYTDLGGGHYRVHYRQFPTQLDPVTGNPVATSVNNLEFRYKVKTGQCTGVNQLGEIEYWLDYNLGGNTALRPPLKKIAKLYQPVMLYCEKNGIEMKEFSLFRVTRGLKDSDENYVPDDGQPALDSEIRHNVYLKNDEGKILVKGTTLGTFNNLYMLLTTDFKLKADVLKVDQATIKVGNGAEEPVDLTHVASDSLFYIGYNKPMAANTDIVLTIPFKATNANNLSKAFDVELYVSNTPQTDPFNPVNRVGEDKTGRTMIVYLDAFATDKSNEAFADNEIREKVTLPYFDSYHGNNFYTPYFSKEVRRLAKPVKYEFEIPEGFLLKSDMRVTNAYRRDQHIKDNPALMLPTEKIEVLANGNTLYAIDFASLFQNDVNTQTAADALPATKWMHPDDIFNYQFAIDMQATKGAAITTKVKATISYLSMVENDSLMTRSKEFNIAYNGDRTTLDIVPNTVKAQEEKLHIAVATVGNPNTYPTEMWIYVEGDVKNVSATPVTPAGSPAIVGTGINGRWVSLGTIAGQSAPNYSIDFESINKVCSPDTIRVYTVSRFQDAGWNPDVSQPADPADLDHIAASKEVYLEPTEATIQASMVTSSNDLVFGTSYDLTATIDSKASESALSKPEMALTIPAGQKYTAGSAKVEFPVGTVVAVPSTVEAQIVAALGSDATLGNSREFTMKVVDLIGTDILHGFGDHSVTDNDRIVSLKMSFLPMCETPLTGIRFEGQPSGENFCGILAAGSDKHERSAEMFSTIAADYEFSVNPVIVSGNRAFNEIRTEDQLKVDIVKIRGTDALLPADALHIELPKYMDLKDAANITLSSTDISTINGTKATLVSNEEVGETRIIILKLPVNEINAISADHGLTKGLSYTIDLVYTPNRGDAELVNNPEQTIRTLVTTNKQFSPTCPDAPLAIGTGNVGVALVTASENPYKGQENVAMTLEIISTGFAGEWFDVATGGTALSSTATYDYTPTDSNDKTFYVSSIFNGVDYGRVPIIVSSLPLLDFTVTNPAPLCADSQIDLATLVSGVASGVTIKFYSDVATQNEVTNTTVTVTGNTSYYATATNGVSTSPAKEIVIQTLATTVITTQPMATTVNNDGTITLNVAAGGENLTYQWKKDGVDISGATNATYTKANATETESGIYSVAVAGDCGTVTSNNAQVLVYPSLDFSVTTPSPICATESIDLATLVTSEPGITVKFYSDAAAQNELASTVVTPSSTTTYYAKSVNAGGAESAIELIEVKVNPSAEATIASATSIVCANTNGQITLALTGTAPWTVVYTDGTRDYTVTATSSSYTFDVLVAAKTTYTLKSVTDALNCGNGIINTTPATIDVEETLEIVTQPLSTSFCMGDHFSLDVVASGTVVEYQWYRNGAKLNGETRAHLEVNNAERSASGDYYVIVVGKCGTVKSNTVKVRADLTDIIVQKWNNTLVANNNSTTNGGYNFVAYKWFKNGTQIDEGPYHTVGDNPNNTLDMGAAYTVEVTTDQGEVYTTCPFYPTMRNSFVKLYPTVVNANEPVYLEIETEDGATPNGNVEIYNVSGNSFKAPKVLERVTPILLPASPGIYILKFKSATISQDFKVIVK